MMMIWCILCSFYALASGLDVGFSYQSSCFSDGGTVEMTATYTGSGTVTAVQWYYSGQALQNLIVDASTCNAVTPIDTGYPPAGRMQFECDTATNVYKLRLLSLEADEYDESWGATFFLSVGASPVVVQKQIEQCTTPPGGLGWWIILIIVIAIVLGLFSAGIILGCCFPKKNQDKGCCCDCFYNCESDCCDNCVSKENCPCCKCCFMEGIPTWYRILWFTVIGTPVALGMFCVLKRCKGY